MSSFKRVLVALNTWDFTSGLLKGIQSYALLQPNLHLHFCLLVTEAPEDVRLVRNMIAHFHPHGVLARVFWKRSELRLDAGVPLVGVGDRLRPAYPTVMLDQEGGGRMVADHLLAQGVEHFAFAAMSSGGAGIVAALAGVEQKQYAFAAASSRDYNVNLRWKGFQGRLLQAGQTCHRFEDFEPVRHDAMPTHARLNAWLTQLPLPIGIHAYNMGVAVRVLWACQELGLKVPNDVALVAGQDQIALATAWTPSLSALDFNSMRAGYESMRLLDRLMRGDAPPAKPMLVPPVGVVPRQSSDLRGMRDGEIARIRRLVRERSHQPLAVKEVLAFSALSRSALERRFQKHLSHSLHDEIVLARMERAQRLLRETLLPATQVAAQSGYANYAVFSVAFRKHTGMTALKYRQQGMVARGF